MRELNWTPYALSRVIDLARAPTLGLLRRCDRAGEHASPYGTLRTPNSVAELADFAGRFGAHLHEQRRFHPLFHEIVQLVEDDTCMATPGWPGR